MLIRDHLVRRIGEEQIADDAARLRSLLGVEDEFPLDIVGLIKRLIGWTFPRKGPLNLRIFDKKEGERDAYVTFDPLTIHVDEELWRLAEIGDPWSRFVIAHELGHVTLHSNDAKSYSGKDSGFGIFGTDEVSAEWQANTFAGHLLAPDSLASSADEAQTLATQCNIEALRARDRLDSVKRRRLWKARSVAYWGDACPGCANFTLVRNRTCLKCETCGATTGCS